MRTCNFMIIPNRNPREIRMRALQVQIRAIRTQPRPVVIQRVDNLAIWRWHTANAIPVTIVPSTSILVVVIPEMQHIVNTVLSPWVSVGIEETERVVTARIHCQTDLRDVVVWFWCRLRSADWALVVAAADAELVVVSSERLQSCRFDLDSVVDVG